jgi:DNA modification methylase
MSATYRILTGHCLDTLATLADKSVHCVVTSPPYWNLRDYGTAQWEGGDKGCDHKIPLATKGGCAVGNKQSSNPGSYGYREWLICGRCGAKRIDLQIGLEETPEAYVEKLVQVFREVRRVLRDDGTVWLNLGDSYWGGKGKSGYELPHEAAERRGKTLQTSHNMPGYMDMRPSDGKHPIIKPKDLVGIPWRVALALQADGWYLRSDIIWAKPNPMPESVTDRPTKAHEYIFLLSKSQRYYYDAEAVKEPVAESTVGRGPVDFGGKKGREYKPDANDPNFRNGKEQWGRTYDYQESSASGRNKRTVWTVDNTLDEFLKFAESQGVDVEGLIAAFIGGQADLKTVWKVATHPFTGAHFATFPPKLIEPCILAGTSEKGCCAECGAPWERVVERAKPSDDVYTSTSKPESINGVGNRQVGMGQKYQEFLNANPPTTTGWKPTCTCNAGEPIPCTVLDPFGGSGTSAVVSLSLGRNAILCELSEEYAAMARTRIEAKATTNPATLTGTEADFDSLPLFSID